MDLIQDVQRKVEEAGGDEERGVELNHMGLTEVSDGVAELLLRVRKLSLTGNMLTDLPPLMGHMTQLRYLDPREKVDVELTSMGSLSSRVVI